MVIEPCLLERVIHSNINFPHIRSLILCIIVAHISPFWKKPASPTYRFAIQARDHLQTVLAISNGLRPSNLMNLTIRNIRDATTDDAYPGFQIITNYEYKTSTIYGEKFIVVTHETYGQLLYYIDNSRPFVRSSVR